MADLFLSGNAARIDSQEAEGQSILRSLVSSAVQRFSKA